MKISPILIKSYLVSLVITIMLAIIDSDPIISFSSLFMEVLILSVLGLTVIFPISILARRAKKKNERQRTNS